LFTVDKVEAYDQGAPQKIGLTYLLIRILPPDYTGIVFIPPVIQISVPSSKRLRCRQFCLSARVRSILSIDRGQSCLSIGRFCVYARRFSVRL